MKMVLLLDPRLYFFFNNLALRLKSMLSDEDHGLGKDLSTATKLEPVVGFWNC